MMKQGKGVLTGLSFNDNTAIFNQDHYHIYIKNIRAFFCNVTHKNKKKIYMGYDARKSDFVA